MYVGVIRDVLDVVILSVHAVQVIIAQITGVVLKGIKIQVSNYVPPSIRCYKCQ